MGSLGCWVRCYWCHDWVFGPYIVDWIERPLCDTCFDRHGDGLDNNEPPRPNARCHRANALLIVLPQLGGDFEVARHIAEFLERRYRPGAGSTAVGQTTASQLARPLLRRIVAVGQTTAQ